MEVFKASQPDFYASHFAARVIVDRTDSDAVSQKRRRKRTNPGNEVGLTDASIR